MHILSTICLAGLALSQGVLAATSDDWRSRSIYQVLTDRFARTDQSTTAVCNTSVANYCGGTWAGMIDKLDYIQGMGFDAVWISPITAQLEGSTPYGWAFHGYWQQNIDALNSYFGTSADLQALSAALHARGMYLMVDVVVNHFAWNGTSSSIDYANFTPFNNTSYFHPYCPINYTDTADLTQIENCWLGDEIVALPDLMTETAEVADVWNSWISSLVSTYNIDGLRLDSAEEVDPAFWAAFIAAAEVYMVGEVYDTRPSLVCSYQGILPGVLNYPTYWPLFDAFTNTTGDITALASMITEMKETCEDVTLLGSFSENHDLPRIASITSDLSQAQNIITFTMLQDGIPIIYEGQEQHYAAIGGSNAPYNREAIWLSGYNTSAPLYSLVSILNRARKNAISVDPTYLSYNNWPVHIDSNTISMRKGNMLTILSNQGTSGPTYTLNLNSTFDPNTTLTELLSCTQQTVDDSGNLAAPMSGGWPLIYYPTADIGSQCASANTTKRRARSVPMRFRA